MAKVKLLVGTDIFIDYFNSGFLSTIFEKKDYDVYCSIVTKKELLQKSGLRESQRYAILFTLKNYELIPVDNRTTSLYLALRSKYPFMGKEDTLIAACALSGKLPLVTRNWKHYKHIPNLILFPRRLLI